MTFGQDQGPGLVAEMLGRNPVWCFDCDGVLLDSNAVKTEAFRYVCLRYGSKIADDVVAHHVAHGGVSRFEKFNRLFSELLHRGPEEGELEGLLDEFARESRRGLSSVRTDQAAHRVAALLRPSGVGLYVVSGGAESEVTEALERAAIGPLFDGIFGSPVTKRAHLQRLQAEHPGRTFTYVGDSRTDMEIALELGMRAVFVWHWTEFADWRQEFEGRSEILVVRDLSELADLLAAARTS